MLLLVVVVLAEGLGFPLASAAGAADPVMLLGANGDGPTVLIVLGGGAAAEGAGDKVVWLFAGDDVRPRVEGRGMCRDFWYRPRKEGQG